jgi:hypothetical protein
MANTFIESRSCQFARTRKVRSQAYQMLQMLGGWQQSKVPTWFDAQLLVPSLLPLNR